MATHDPRAPRDRHRYAKLRPMRIPEFDASPSEIRGFAIVQVVLVGVFLAVLGLGFGFAGVATVWG